MIVLRLILAGVAAASLTACAAVTPPAPPAPMPSTSVTSTPDAPETSSAPTSVPTGADGDGDPAAAVQSYGAGSKQCAAASTLLKNATTFAVKASLGSATQADFEKAYTGAAANDLPVDGLPAFADLKTASLTVVGLSKDKAEEHLSQFALALGNFTRVAQKICS